MAFYPFMLNTINSYANDSFVSCHRDHLDASKEYKNKVKSIIENHLMMQKYERKNNNKFFKNNTL